MTCPSPFIDAGVADLVWRPLVSVRLPDSTALASGPAATTETPLSNGARAAMIAARCKNLRHANNVQRKRFMAVHTALATYLAGRDA